MGRLRMKDYGIHDRPREKLLLQGNRSVSDAELLAILIGSGTTHENVLHLSNRILNDMGGNLNHLAKLSVDQLCKYPGVGKVKAVLIIAALELGRRRDAVPLEKRPFLNSSVEVYKLMRPTFRDLKHEESWVIFVDASLRFIAKFMVGRGGIDFTPFDLKVVLRLALENSARSLFLVHNHPSGNLKASAADIALTERIYYACPIIDVHLNDHVIITDSGYISLRDEGVFNSFE